MLLQHVLELAAGFWSSALAIFWFFLISVLGAVFMGYGYQLAGGVF